MTALPTQARRWDLHEKLLRLVPNGQTTARLVPIKARTSALKAARELRRFDEYLEAKATERERVEGIIARRARGLSVDRELAALEVYWDQVRHWLEQLGARPPLPVLEDFFQRPDRTAAEYAREQELELAFEQEDCLRGINDGKAFDERDPEELMRLWFDLTEARLHATGVEAEALYRLTVALVSRRAELLAADGARSSP